MDEELKKEDVEEVLNPDKRNRPLTFLEIVVRSDTSRGSTNTKMQNMIKAGKLKKIILDFPDSNEKVTFYRSLKKKDKVKK